MPLGPLAAEPAVRLQAVRLQAVRVQVPAEQAERLRVLAEWLPAFQPQLAAARRLQASQLQAQPEPTSQLPDCR